MLKIPDHKVNANVPTISFHLTPVRMAIRMNTTPNAGGDAGKAFKPCWCDYKLIQPLLKTVWRLLKN
jgi:hypothetical protein